MTDLTEIVARLRAEAEDRRHLDLPMTVKPSDILPVLDAVRLQPEPDNDAPRPLRAAAKRRQRAEG
jgi:hypothetical protein